MKINKISRVITGSALAFTLLFSTLVPTVKVEAASNSTSVRTHITVDGARLRKEGWLGGIVLGIMYKGEVIDYYKDIHGSDGEYRYMYRIDYDTYGYVRHEYVWA